MLGLGRTLHERLRPLADATPDSPEAEQLEYPVIADLAYGTYGGRVWASVRAADPHRAVELVPLMRKRATEIPDVDSSINQAGLFVTGWNRASRSIDINIREPELTRLVELREHIQARARELIPGATAYTQPTPHLAAPEIHAVPKKFHTAEMGLTSSELGYSVSALVDGAYATSYFHNGEDIDLTIVGRDDVSINKNDVPIAIPSGQVVPL